MNTRLQTDIWISRIFIVLGFIVAVSVLATLALTIIGWPILEILVAFGAVAMGGLARLLSSPLNREL